MTGYHRAFFAAVISLGLCVPALAEPAVVYKSPTCQCCSKWIDHMTANGFSLSPRDLPRSELNRVKAGLGLRPEHASCHTAVIDGYVIEGHVPAEDVKRLIAEKPDAIGLSVPDMPIGSPGMEMDGRTEPYDVLLIAKDGSSGVFAKH